MIKAPSSPSFGDADDGLPGEQRWGQPGEMQTTKNSNR